LKIAIEPSPLRCTLQRIITTEQEQLLRRERSLLDDLRVLLARLGAPDDDLELLKESLQRLDELFLLVVVGEFNAGKSAFLNALLGARLLDEGVLPTTNQINLLRYGGGASQTDLGHDVRLVQLPVDWLQEINLVDTPGTNAIIQRHQEITEEFVPRSDLVLFVTSADRPFTESERQFLTRIRQWGKKIVLVVNKIDLIESAADRSHIAEYVRTNGLHLLGVAPQVFTVSARQALQAKTGAQGNLAKLNNDPNWVASQFGELETFLLKTLDVTERMRLQLSNPLGIADALGTRYRQLIDGRRELLQTDFQTLGAIDEQLAAYEADMRRDFKYHLSHVDNVLYAMAERGDQFFDETMRLGRVFDLMNSAKISADFERAVVADTAHEIERQVGDLIDWIVDQEYRQWRAAMEFLNRRAAQYAEQIVGQVGGEFELNRQSLLASVGRQARAVVDDYQPDVEAQKLAEQVQTAVMQAAAVEVGAIGLGAILVVALHTTLLDVTGVLGASALAALGFYVLPYRRNKLKQELHERVNTLRGKLSDALTRQFEKELGDSLQRMHEAIAPYTRFVRVERDKLEQVSGDLGRLNQELAAVRGAVERIA
jgi:small GTP-binding protein